MNSLSSRVAKHWVACNAAEKAFQAGMHKGAEEETKTCAAICKEVATKSVGEARKAAMTCAKRILGEY